MLRLGPLEWTMILLILVLLFGPGRIGKVAGEIGKGIKNFREGLSGTDDEAEKKSDTPEQK